MQISKLGADNLGPASGSRYFLGQGRDLRGEVLARCLEVPNCSYLCIPSLKNSPVFIFAAGALYHGSSIQKHISLILLLSIKQTWLSMTKKQPLPQQTYSETPPAKSDDGIEVGSNNAIHQTKRILNDSEQDRPGNRCSW